MFALPLTKQGTTATSSPKKTTTNQIPSKPHHLFPRPPKKTTSHSSPSNHGMDQVQSIGTPILCLEFGTNAHWRRLNIWWCITNQVQRPHRFRWILEARLSQPMARHVGMVFWCFVSFIPVRWTRPRTSNDQPAVLVASRFKFQVISLHSPGMVFQFGGNSVDGLMWLDGLLSKAWLTPKQSLSVFAKEEKIIYLSS